MQRFIGFGGQLANGKDECADYIKYKLNKRGGNWDKVAFAGGLKDLFMQMYNVDKDFIEYWKRKDECPPGFIMPVRNALQLIGDDLRKVKSNVWIDRLFNTHTENDLLVADARYTNEADAIRERGGRTIMVFRSTHLNDIAHPSESQYIPYINFLKDKGDGPVKDSGIPFDWFIANDGTLEDLKKKIDNGLLEFVDYGT